ncbi:unnamed protein product [Rhizophagus irregularis]|uniref:PB1 domain-containing protein n=1 Tax=Rhizophagus irregularis TaxID=588596 RepID=A0A2N1MY45_9GLOM|nr:hypothetical protein RhiirC2_753356 [Rhizophagus irregularis]CAB4377297.1 unnamed protein product [Rhizophagus irregularis]CAB5383445.1 unnamed protein product [Rhizophagus irregularis]
MVNIKVIHKKAVRRFTLPSNATWIELEAKLRTLFNIPALSPFTLSYTDEDNDVITLSTDLELQEIFSSAPTVKFDLKFSTSDDSSDSEDSGNEVWVLEGRNILPSKEAASATTDISGLQENVSQKNIVSSTNQELQEPQFIEIDSRDLTENETSNKTDENSEKEDEKEKTRQVNLLDDEFFESLNSLKLTKPINEIEAIETIESTPSEQDQPQEDSAVDLQQFQMIIEQNQDAIIENPQLIASIKDIMDQIRQLDSFREPIMKSRKRNKNFLNRPITPPIPGCTRHSFNVFPTSEFRSLTPPPIPGAFPKPPQSISVPWAARPPGGGRGRYHGHHGHHGHHGRRFHGNHHHHHHDDSYDNHEQREKILDEGETPDTEETLEGTTDEIFYQEKFKKLKSMGFEDELVKAELEKAELEKQDDFEKIIDNLLKSQM